MTGNAETASLPGGTTVLVEIADRIAWVTMNRPEKRNAINPTMSFEMLDVFDALEADERCGVVVLTGAGDAYSSGMDLREYFRATDKLSYDERMKIMRRSATAQWKRLQFYGKPTIAMVNGWCFGGAFNSLVACDLAIAAEDAAFGLSEINWGIIPAGTVTKAVASVMGQRDCMYYIMTGETFDGRKASATGLGQRGCAGQPRCARAWKSSPRRCSRKIRWRSVSPNTRRGVSTTCRGRTPRIICSPSSTSSVSSTRKRAAKRA